MTSRVIPCLALVGALAMTACDGNAGDASKAVALDTVSGAAPTDVAIDMIDTADGKGRYIAKRDGRTTQVAFPLALGRVAPDIFHTGQRLGETDAGVVVMIDEYASRAAGGRCSDGTEAFVRVFSLPLRREVMATPVESCLDGVRGADPRAEWLGDGMFRINGPTPTTYRIDGTGGITKLAEQN